MQLNVTVDYLLTK